MSKFTISDFVKHLKTYPQDAEIAFASVTAWAQDNVLISWDTDHDLPSEEVVEETTEYGQDENEIWRNM